MNPSKFFRGAAAAVAALSITNFAYADPPGRVARLSFIEGEVSFAAERAGRDDNWSAAKTNWPITAGNRLYTGDNARAELHVGASALRLTENTDIDFTRLDDERIETFLDRGSLTLTLRNWDRDDKLIVSTRILSVTLNSNGRYRIDVDDDSANVVVHQGEAQIQNGASRFSLFTAQRAEIAGLDGDDVRITRDDDEDDFDRWATERDSRQNIATSSRYVAPTTPGAYELDQYGQWRETGEYGYVWRPNNVAADWAPYRYGRWEWIAPWGWTWIDDAPWGYAPSHYGRWVYVDSYWAWHPGRFIARPVYAPALVSFVSGPGFSVSVNVAQPYGWVPLAPFEVYYPYYQSSHRYVERINVTHVHRDHVIERDYRHSRDHHRNRDFPGGVTIVNPRVLIDHLPVARAVLPIERSILRDISRIAPPLPPLPRIGGLLPRPNFERNVEHQRPRRDNEDRSRQPERKFQAGGPAPAGQVEQARGRDRDRPHRQPDYQIPRHEVDTRVPFALEGQRPLPHNARRLPHNNQPLPQNTQPLPRNDRPLPQNNRPLPGQRGEHNVNSTSDGKAHSGGAPGGKKEKWMTNPR